MLITTPQMLELIDVKVNLKQYMFAYWFLAFYSLLGFFCGGFIIFIL
jgi:hypothetical protein